MKQRLIWGLLTAIPAAVLGSLAFLTFEPDAYYTLPWQIAAVVFVAGSFLLGMRLAGRGGGAPAGRSDAARNQLFFCGVMAWILAVAAVGLVSLTPLCVGQDNGDGNNGYAECVFFAVSSSIAYSMAVVPALLLGATVLALVFGRRKSD